MIENEDYITIEVWNEQAGVWETTGDECKTMEDARELVNSRIEQDFVFFGEFMNTFSIVQHKRTCFGKYAPRTTN